MAPAPDLETLKRDAASGRAAAQYKLGMWHLRQQDPDVDHQAARAALEAAADQGFAPAISALGYMSLRAQGTDYDPQRAADMFQRAATAGFPEARYRLAEMYAVGSGRGQDLETARQYFCQAAEAGHAGAMCQYAYCLFEGLGGPSDRITATHWYAQAALTGEPRALCCVGWRFETGHTLNPDPARALACYMKALRAGYPGGGVAANRLAITLDDESIARAQLLSGAPLEMPPIQDIGASQRSSAPRVIGWKPRCVLFKDLLSQEECLHLIAIAKPFLRVARVLDRSTGKRVLDPARRAQSARLRDPLRDLVVWNVAQRLARYSMIPPENAEPITVLYYARGDEYRPHHDYYDPRTPGSRAGLAAGGQRVATFLVYLNEVEAGGETRFPDADVSVPPVAGCGLLFFNCKPDGTPDRAALHAGAPVISGEKWLLSSWIRSGAYPLDEG
ncbi:MAG: 2OG-Fe(II) oxygenase [Gammaproteobacteria bacterium]